jgi:tetratricopeptide (TPR) repeat protein
MFFLIPAVIFVLSENNKYQKPSFENLSGLQKFLSGICLIFFVYTVYFLFKVWVADYYFAAGYRASKSQNYPSAYQYISKAINLNPSEPLYFDEISYPAAQIALAFQADNQATTASEFTKQAIAASDKAVSISSNNVNFLKTRTKVFYTLSQIDPQYVLKAVETLEDALLLSPTDPKLFYNLALLYDQIDKQEEAVELLVKSTELKPDFRDAYYALAVFYSQKKNNEKAKENIDFILKRINPNDDDAKKLLNEIEK